MKELREYQVTISEQANEILTRLKIVYLAMEVRTGKSATSLNTAKLYGARNVLFLTKKIAIKSIEQDYKDFGFTNDFDLTVINDESMHKIEGDFDLVIHDEHHRFGAFPKPGKYTKLYKQKYKHLPMIFLSGTIHPESFSQIYHQFWVSDHSPFRLYTNFYKWAKTFVDVQIKYVAYGPMNDYSKGKQEDIKKFTDPYIITFTQKESGFTSTINEHILHCKMSNTTTSLINRLRKDMVIEGKEEVILADTGVRMMGKVHQLSSGTIKFESGNSQVIDTSKGEFIKQHFKGKKIAIFYKFKAEYALLKQVFLEHLTNDLEEFNATDKNIALQIVSGREGVSLREADYLVYFNIDFSATSYFQSRDRLTTMERKTNDIYWIFGKGGIESYIYKAVNEKKNFTLSVFRKTYERIPIESN